MDLRAKRLAAGLSQSDLAAKLGITQRQVSSWERGRATPQARWYPRLASLLQISADDAVAMFAAQRAARSTQHLSGGNHDALTPTHEHHLDSTLSSTVASARTDARPRPLGAAACAST